MDVDSDCQNRRPYGLDGDDGGGTGNVGPGGGGM